MVDPTLPNGPAPPPRRRPAGPPPGAPAPSTPEAGRSPVDPVDDDDLWVRTDDDADLPPTSDRPPAEVDDHHDLDHPYDDDLFDDDYDYDDDDHDYVDLPRPGRVPRWAALAGVMVVLAAVVVGAGWVWYNRQVDPPGSPGEIVTVDVPSGATVQGIGAILEDRGVISNATVFNFYAGRRDAGPFQAGVYELRLNSDFDLVLDTLAAGPVQPALAEPAERVTIPEGLVIARILDRVAANVPGTSAEEMRAALDAGEIDTTLRPSDQPSYEGLLFPATYEVTDGLTGVALLQQMAGEMEVRLQRLGVDAARTRLAEEWGLELTDYDFLKVASMVQAEAGNVDEAPQIATVIYNRLAQGMPLGIDAVDRYGAELAGTSVDFNDRSAPYNTRRNPGLPPTPISAPGEFAIAAALQPATGPWMYYVLETERQHAFLVTDSEFQAAKRVCIERNLGCG